MWFRDAESVQEGRKGCGGGSGFRHAHWECVRMEQPRALVDVDLTQVGMT